MQRGTVPESQRQPRRIALNLLDRRSEREKAHRARLDACLWALVAARWWAARAQAPARVVAAGLDALELWTAAPLRPLVWARVQAAQLEAVESKRPGQLHLAGLVLEVDPRWVRSCRASSDLWDIIINPAPQAGHATVKVECRALALWSLGHRAAADKALAVLAELAAGELDAQVGRVDLCADFQGWTPTPDDARAFSAKGRRRAPYFQPRVHPLQDPAWLAAEAQRVERLARQLAGADAQRRAQLLALIHTPADFEIDATHQDGRKFTGWSWSLGAPFSARLYWKSWEMVVRRKGWMRTTWARDPAYQASAPTWRLEFQLRRAALRTFQFRDEGPPEDLGSWAALQAKLPQLWAYCTRTWLRHGGRRADTRQVPTPAWAQLQGAWTERVGAALGVPLHRAALEGAAELVTPAVAGYLTTAAAQLLELGEAPQGASLEELLGKVVAAAWKAHGRTHEETPEERIEAKRAPIARRRRLVAELADWKADLRAAHQRASKRAAG